MCWGAEVPRPALALTPALLGEEQMAESGGENWSEILAMAQSSSLANVFFLGNAYCGSRECRKEIQFADMKRFKMIPVFIEAWPMIRSGLE